MTDHGGTVLGPRRVQQAFSGEVEVRRRRFVNPESGFAVLDCSAGDERVVLVGPLSHLEERECVQVTGVWVRDQRFGLQLRVSEAHPLPPSGAEAAVPYLRRVRHIGRRRARELVERFGDDVIEAIDRDPAAAFAAVGVRGRRADEALRSWDALRSLRELHLLLAPHGLAYLAARINREYGDAAHRVVRERPYELTRLFGVGFGIADRIGRVLGVPADSPQRAGAAVLHCLSEAERGGSTCLPLGELGRRTAALLGSEEPPGRQLLEWLAAEGTIALVEEDRGPWVYRAETERLEAELGERVLELATSRRALRVPRAAPRELTLEQWAGVRAAFARRLSVITGGPGTGKTASIRAIAALAATQKAAVLLVAPTGRAAKRMTEASGIPARTIHSALGWVPGHGPMHDDDEPLECDLLIVDETSMASLEVLVTLLRAVGPDTHVVLVGDADQLAPVGAGKPFAELVESGLVPAARLTRIFRQAAGSMIVQGAHAVRAGHAPSFDAREGMRRDLFLVRQEDPVAAREEIVSLVAQRLPAHFGVDPLADVQVFAPVYRGELGIDALNRDLRGALNAAGEPACGGRLRIGDKLMLTGRNLHELGLMNGTLLRLVAGGEEDDDGGVVVEADGALFELDQDDAERLQLAYACSVHKGQGIELPVAIVVAHPAAGGNFLRREMLYTAITRATVATVVVGTPEAVTRAARTADTGRRYSRLVWRLRAGHR
jgi:exodeoxyribonuclease V alpha subunit